MNKSFNTLIESILEAGYKGPASINEETDWDDPTERYWDRSPRNSTICTTINSDTEKRQNNKNKLIDRKQKLIKNHQDQLNNWLERISSNENISIVAIETQRRKFQKKINKEIEDLEILKKLPITDDKFK